MSSATSTVLFLIVWLIALFYVLSVARLEFAVQAMKRQGKLLDAPVLFNAMEGFRGLAWLLGGRFEKEGDETVAHRARLARIMFYVSAPVAAVFLVTAVVLFLTVRG